VLVLIYDLVEDYVERRAPLRADHLDLIRAAHERGELHLAGAFVEPFDHALFVWSTADESIVRRFVEADPYVVNGLVTAWQIRSWNVVIGEDGAAG
jgi:uncharacterized protein YciI